MAYGITIRITGSRACFTRPEFNTERVSYDVLTPSAARGIIESVYYKPQIKWLIDSITVLNPIRFASIRRNEVGVKGTLSSFAKARDQGGVPPHIDVTEKRQQRNTLYLTDVDYIVKAHFELTGLGNPEEDTVEKHYNIALRRLRKGQSFNQPYLGCREFAADVALVEGDADVSPSYYRDEDDLDLGFMLYDIDYDRDLAPLFFRAHMRHGVIDVASARREVLG